MKLHHIARTVIGLTALWTTGCQPVPPQRVGALTPAASVFTLTSAAAIPAGTVREDVPFTTVDGQTLKLDLHYPTTPTYQPLPVVVFVHGGSWQAGDKGDIQVGSDGLILKELQARGFLVASVNYRLAPGALFPAPIDDVRSAVTYLKREAGTINVDPNRVAAWGSSAGGHLAAMVGLTAAEAGGVTLKAVIDNFGPTDLTQESLYWKGEMEMVQDWAALIGMSKKALPAWLKRYSPVTHVTAGAPPFLILHGDKDSRVPIAQSQALAAKLTAAGVSAELITVAGGGHGFSADDTTLQPTASMMATRVGEFLTQTL